MRPSAPVCLVTSTLPSIFSGEGNRFIHGRRDFHAALKTGFERAFAASARVDLRFDDDLGTCRSRQFSPPPVGPRRAIWREFRAGRGRRIWRAIAWLGIRGYSFQNWTCIKNYWRGKSTFKHRFKIYSQTRNGRADLFHEGVTARAASGIFSRVRRNVLRPRTGPILFFPFKRGAVGRVFGRTNCSAR